MDISSDNLLDYRSMMQDIAAENDISVEPIKSHLAVDEEISFHANKPNFDIFNFDQCEDKENLQSNHFDRRLSHSSKSYHDDAFLTVMKTKKKSTEPSYQIKENDDDDFFQRMMEG